MMEMTPGLTSERARNMERPDYLKKAQLLRHSGERSLALALLRRACSEDTNNFELLKTLGEVLVECGKTSEALIVKKTMKAQFPQFESYFEYAQALYLAGDQDEEALKVYFECLSIMEEPRPEHFEVYKNMGNISVKLKDYDGAEEFYNKAYTINSRSDILLVNFGTLEVQRGDFDKATYCFREALAANPRNDKAWVGLALMHNEYGDHSLAWGNLTNALDLESMNRTAILLCARWALRDRREAYAVPILENFLNQENFDEEISLLLIHLYSCLNQFSKAQLETTKILAWNPQLAAAREIEKQLRQIREVA